MRRRHPVPRVWLMTDERLGDDLWRAVRRLPRGAGIIFRHHATPAAERRSLFRRLRRLAQMRGLVLVRGGDVRLSGEMGTHNRCGVGLRTWSAHSRGEAVTALRRGAEVVFVSPLFPTRSHVGGASLGGPAARRVVIGMPIVTIALGGMNAGRFRCLAGFDGWAGIDAWIDR